MKRHGEEFRNQSLVYQGATGYQAFTTPDNLRLAGRAVQVPATSIDDCAATEHRTGAIHDRCRDFTHALS
jgi:hypothetical protein